MATQVDLGKIRPVWKGAWAATTAYERNDMVREGVNSYICVTAHTSGSTFSDANWHILAYGADIPDQTGNSGKVLTTDGSSLSWGVGVDFQQIRFSESDVSYAGSNGTTWNTVHSESSLPAGKYIAVITYKPSTTDTDYPNSDPDAHGIRLYNATSGTELAFANGTESTPVNYKVTSTLTYYFELTTTSAIYAQLTTNDSRVGGDTDSGGVRGRFMTSIIRVA